ncbi:MAG: L,D-transpeptidase family protein [Christensenellales bacterium]|jgi:peptidoglycan hydrolase-like protein with peptidoglycan-binding domain
MRKIWILCLIALCILSALGVRALEVDETIKIEVTLPTETDIDQVICIDIPPEDDAEDAPADGDIAEDDISPEDAESEEPVQEEVAVRVVPAFTEAPLETVYPCSYGDSGENVRLLQDRLRMLGFTLETPDGLFGKRTREHVREVQRYLNGKTGGPSWHPNGEVSEGLCDELNSLSFPRYERDVSLGSEGITVLRVQRKLYVLGYLGRSKVDSVFGKSTREALSQFQKIAGLNNLGVADRETQNLLFSSVAPDALSAHCEYSLYVNLERQVLSVFAWNNATQTYDKLVREMPCTTGKDGYETPTGTFAVEDHRAQWVYLRMYGAYARYVTVFNDNYYIHSVLYAKKGALEPISGANGALTERVSRGSIRVSTEDAQWIYENCRIGTAIRVE